MKRIIGILMIVLVFVFIYVAFVAVSGFWMATWMFATALFLSAFLIIGIFLAVK